MVSSNSSKPVLDRYLSQTDVWATAFGCIVGWGAFVMPGTTFLPLASPGGTVIGMAASVAIMLVVGANYAYLMKRCAARGRAASTPMPRRPSAATTPSCARGS